MTNPKQPDALAEVDAKLLRERELTTADIATQFAAKAQAAAGGADEQGELAEAMNDHLADGYCHDCGEPEGELHWVGCDMERCPVCGI